MEIALQAFLFVGGLAVALVASDRAVAYTRALATALGAPAFIVGVALVSIGTDLPEIANSIAAHLQSEGDVNVGDSVGSTLTQYTFVLGLTRWLVGEGWLGRWEGIALVSAWALFPAVIVIVLPGHAPDRPPPVA